MGLLDFIFGTREDRFARRAMARLRERGWDGPLTYARDSFALESGENIYLLDRMFADWLTYAKSERADALDEALHSFFDPPISGSYDEVAHLLTPVVRSRHELGGADDEARAGALPTQPLPGSMRIAIAYDQAHSIQYIDAKELERLGRTFQEALQRALANQRATPPCAFELQDDGYHVGDYGKVYASSRLLQPEIFQDLPLKGEPVVMTPARGVLLVAGADDTEALNAMAIFGSHVARTDSRSISFTPLVLREGAWQPFSPQPEVPPAIRQLWDHSEQQEALKASVGARGEDLFVAKFTVSERGGEILTCATWTDDVHTLLPKTEALILHDADWNSICRRWEDVEAVCGAFVREPGLDPPRFRTGTPPDAEAWARLRDEFAPPKGWPELT